MKKSSLTKLVLAGLSGSLLISNGISADQVKNGKAASASIVAKRDQSAKTLADIDPKDAPNADLNAGNLDYRLLSEDELLLELNSEGAAVYEKLSPEGKALAREVASQRCNGTNTCKGLNACKTDKNACAGQGACKGQSICAFSDKNLAVKVAAKKMQEQRQALSK